MVDIDSDGDLKVAMNDGNTWVLNPQCCVKQENDLALVPRTADNKNNNDGDESDATAGKISYIIFDKLICVTNISNGNCKLICLEITALCDFFYDI